MTLDRLNFCKNISKFFSLSKCIFKNTNICFLFFLYFVDVIHWKPSGDYNSSSRKPKGLKAWCTYLVQSCHPLKWCNNCLSLVLVFFVFHGTSSSTCSLNFCSLGFYFCASFFSINIGWIWNAINCPNTLALRIAIKSNCTISLSSTFYWLSCLSYKLQVSCSGHQAPH